MNNETNETNPFEIGIKWINPQKDWEKMKTEDKMCYLVENLPSPLSEVVYNNAEEIAKNIDNIPEPSEFLKNVSKIEFILKK